MKPSRRFPFRMGLRASVATFLLLSYFGALFWAHRRDPFNRMWFSVSGDFGKMDCVAILPKAAVRPLPVLIYMQDAGSGLVRCGNDLRQISELGLAVVAMDYNQTNLAVRKAEFRAVEEWLGRQRWADATSCAWVGVGLGAETEMALALHRRQNRPRVLVCVAGGYLAENGATTPRDRNVLDLANHSSDTTASSPKNSTTCLILRGGQDEIFSRQNAQSVLAQLCKYGLTGHLITLKGQSHSFDTNRQLLFREIGEFCLARLLDYNAFRHYVSVLTWVTRSPPLISFLSPALLWALVWYYFIGRSDPCFRSKRSFADKRCSKLKGTEIALRGVAMALSLIAIAESAIRVLPIKTFSNSGTRFLIQHSLSPADREDFGFLLGRTSNRSAGIETLVEHAQLANYTRNLVRWKVSDCIYRDFILAPEIAPSLDGSMQWRRLLWESFFPRMKGVENPVSAAEIVVRHLRERITIDERSDFHRTVEAIWNHQITNLLGFETVYVAALRSVGVPARLGSCLRAEVYSGSGWIPAPRPILEQLPVD